MATLLELCEKGDLVRIEPPLEAYELPVRCLYGTPEFIEWLENQLPDIQTDTLIDGDMTPFEQVAVLFVDYVSGEKFTEDRRFKRLTYTPDPYVWEFRTDHIRIFGWVPMRDAFICCCGESRDWLATLKRPGYNPYAKYMLQTQYIRETIALSEPKAVVSREFKDVISDEN